MSALGFIDHVSVEDYLEGEKHAELRHEYIYGEVHAMAGATVAHNVITGNISTTFNIASRNSNCRTYSSDMKLRVEEQIFYYPDVMLVCDNPANDYFETNPCVVVEVLSKTTSRNDLFEKRFAYTSISSVQLYLLVDSRKQKVTGFYRSAQGWQEKQFGIDEAIRIPCVDTTLSFEQIYLKSGC